MSIRALKRFGQNFLIDKNILNLIITRADLKSSDCVLEIGPGHGVLTRGLLAQGISFLHAVELDGRLHASLDELTLRDDFALHWADAVKFDYGTLKPFPNKLVANIPYNISTLYNYLKQLHFAGLSTININHLTGAEARSIRRKIDQDAVELTFTTEAA